MISFFRSIAIMLLISLEAFSQNGQIPVGTWRTHFSYKETTSLAVSNDFVYAGSDASFFRFDLDANENQKLTKEQGLVGVGITCMRYEPVNRILIIGYESGNIDYIQDDKEVGNIPDILNSESILGSKSINDIHFHENFAFLSCDFGVVKLDLISKEIPEDYRNLGGESNPALSTAVFDSNDTIFVATANGLMVAEFRPEVNLQDGSNWSFFLEEDDSTIVDSIAWVEYQPGRILMAKNTPGLSRLLRYERGFSELAKWQNFSIKELRTDGANLNVVVGDRVEIWQDDRYLRSVYDPGVSSPQTYANDRFGKDWVGNFVLGLVSNRDGSFKTYSPDGPFSSLAQHSVFLQDKMVIAGGFYNPDNAKQSQNISGFYEFASGEWENFNSTGNPSATTIPFLVRDIVSSTYNPVNASLYYSSNGFGLVERDINDNWFLYDETNSPLRNQDPTNAFRAVRILDAQSDPEGNIWVSNALVGNNFHKFTPPSTWESYVLNGEPANIVFDNVGSKWIRGLPNRDGGVIVFNEDEPQQQKKLNTNPGFGGLPNNRVNAIATDLNGDIWVGTDDGVAVFFSPEDIFSSSPSDAVTPIFDGRPLLRFEKVTAIAVDGGNRKWIGTNTGVWLFTEDGTEVVENFRENNSPLPSDKIIQIGIHPNTGEVFFITEEGIVSYRGTATAAEEVHSNVEVFPNPVPPGYNGMITISGLVNNANVKITDVNGRLFYEMTASGGTAAWNGKDYNGNRPKSGVYMVFSSDNDGSETFVAKIGFIE